MNYTDLERKFVLGVFIILYRYTNMLQFTTIQNP